MKSKHIGHPVTILGAMGENRFTTQNMKHVKKLLVVHGDAKARRQLTLLLAGVGFDVRAAETVEEALEKSHAEIFDLAMVEHGMGLESGDSCVSRLRKVQPTMPAVFLVPQLDVPLVVAGIRAGVEDVLSLSGDMGAVIRRICVLVGAEDCAHAGMVALESMAESESVLASVGPRENTMGHGLPLRDEAAALKLIRESVADLEGQKQAIAAAQSLLDEKARALEIDREELMRDRQRFAEEHAGLATGASGASPESAVLAGEREALDAWRRDLAREAERVRTESIRLQQERTQLDMERRRWHDDMDLLREEESNLRQYEARLRDMQARMEADRVEWASAHIARDSRPVLADGGALKEAWGKLQRATEIFEAERAHLREDRLAFREMEKAIKKREEAITLKERQYAANERRMRETIQREVQAQAPLPAAPAEEPSTLRNLTRTPFAVAKAVFGGGS